MTDNETQPRPKFLTPTNRYVRLPANVKLSTNSKEEFEVLSELFIGNDLYEQAKIAMDVKLTKMVDLI